MENKVTSGFSWMEHIALCMGKVKREKKYDIGPVVAWLLPQSISNPHNFSDQGPWPYKDGPSYSKLNLTVAVDEDKPLQNAHVHVGFTELVLQSTDDGRMEYMAPNLCQNPLLPDWARVYVLQFDENNPREAYINLTFNVEVPTPLCAWVQLCADGSVLGPGTLPALLTGNAIFENPYGYLPGTMYALLPLLFSTLLLLCGVFIFYTILFVRHRETSLPLHLGTLAVLFLGICEALASYLAVKYVNHTGTPFCCPSPGIVLVSVSIKIVMRATFRCLILCVCLGYGIVHPKLSKMQTFFVILLTALFIITGIYSAWYKMLSEGTVKKQNGAADLPAFFVDSAFMIWIYISLVTQLEDLHAKHEMYKVGHS